MTEVDRVLKPIKVSFEGNVDLSELYHLIKNFMRGVRPHLARPSPKGQIATA